MKVTVQFTTQIRTALGRSEEEVEVAADATVHDLLLQLSKTNDDVFTRLVLDDDQQLLPNLLVTVNDQQVTSTDTHQLSDGDTVLLLSTISGG